jgi:hypothetical protein
MSDSRLYVTLLQEQGEGGSHSRAGVEITANQRSRGKLSGGFPHGKSGVRCESRRSRCSSVGGGLTGTWCGFGVLTCFETHTICFVLQNNLPTHHFATSTPENQV